MRRIKKKPRFYADEDFPTQAVEIMRDVGLNVVTAVDAGKRDTLTRISLPKPSDRAESC